MTIKIIPIFKGRDNVRLTIIMEVVETHSLGSLTQEESFYCGGCEVQKEDTLINIYKT